jgi:hypothetical protein
MANRTPALAINVLTDWATNSYLNIGRAAKYHHLTSAHRSVHTPASVPHLAGSGTDAAGDAAGLGTRRLQRLARGDAAWRRAGGEDLAARAVPLAEFYNRKFNF